jgi:O-antigen/teichoic acid export membrane protein
MENLKEKTAKGLFWGALNNGSMQVLNVLIGILLGRMLSPEEWAPIGMIAIFSAIAGNVQSSGFSTAIINMRQPTDNDYNAVFWFNTLTSCCIYVLLFALAPWIAVFFNQPCLTDLSRFIFLAFLISSFGISTNAFMMKNMMQREMTIVSLSALVVSGATAVILAFLDYSYWSLAWQQVVNATVLVLGRWFFVKWRPTLKFDFTPIRQTFRFSMNILVTMIVSTVNNNILTFVFGKLFSRTPQVVGNFFQAFKWDMMAYQMVGGTIDQVAQPVLVSLRDDEDDQREIRVFRKMLRFTSLLAFPAMFGLSMVAEEFILATIGPRWTDSVPLLRVLCISGAFMPFYALYKNLVISQQRSDVNMRLNVEQIILQFLLILLTYRQGILTVVFAYSMLNILWLLAWQWHANRLIGLRFSDILKDTIPFALLTLVVMAVTYVVTLPVDNVYLLLCLRVAVAALLYVGVMKMLHVKMMDECLQFIFKKLHK